MTKLYKTYSDSVNGYMKEKSIHEVEKKELLKDFAKFLDGFQVGDEKFQIAALQGARRIDREMMDHFINEVGIEKAHEIALLVSNKHRHYSQWQDQVNRRGGKSSLIGPRFKLYAWLTWRARKFWPQALKWGLTKPTERLPEDKEKQLNEARENIKNTQ